MYCPETEGLAGPRPRAIVYCEAHFGAITGETANALTRDSERFTILSIIDSRLAGLDAGAVLDGKPNGIPVCLDLHDAMTQVGTRPDLLIIGMVPTNGLPSAAERRVASDAARHGLKIANWEHRTLTPQDQ